MLFLDQDGEPVDVERRWLGGDLQGHGRHHPLRPWILKRFRPRGAIFVSPEAEAADEVEMLREHGVPVAVLLRTVAHAELVDRFSPLDPTERLMGDLRHDRWSERAEEPRERPRETIPYAFVLQRLIGEWTRMAL